MLNNNSKNYSISLSSQIAYFCKKHDMKNGSFKHQQSLKIPKSIVFTGKFLQFLSSDWATLFAQKIFITPIKFKTPKREMEMLEKAIKYNVYIPTINKSIVTYKYGNGDKKALIIHGWNGRGTQLVTIANRLKKEGFTIVSFDAPGHGFSPKNNSNMTEFIEIALFIQKEYGEFDVVIGHSLGGMSTINAIQRGLKAKKTVIIGSGDVVEDIIDDFVKQLHLKSIIASKMKVRFENQFQQSMDSFCVHKSASQLTIPILVIHDEQDLDVPVLAAHSIYKHIKNGELMITQNLGHRKILGSKNVINRINNFINNE
ncbi:Pimeloyl-ACP methyl ester carboxylesterase [Myroides guanonis]|uniref:Pimeloyl-ACP methyl ester carboxylesterase n=2 Tax=Myroides guanonis TaxID=1150112 RepID=A0A1I3QUV4_9FLAO|nr:Pimeloyl-ACP methyl ester carboxylesterase [Myroides guanonis]